MIFNPVLTCGFAATQITFQWVLLPESDLWNTALRSSDWGRLLPLMLSEIFSNLKIFCDLLAAFTSRQDQNCSSLLTKTSERGLCAGCEHLNAQLPSLLALWCFWDLFGVPFSWGGGQCGLLKLSWKFFKLHSLRFEHTRCQNGNIQN